MKLLQDVLANDRSPKAHEEALDELADLPDGAGIPTLIDAARTHPNRDLRAKAWRELSDASWRRGRTPQRD